MTTAIEIVDLDRLDDQEDEPEVAIAPGVLITVAAALQAIRFGQLQPGRVVVAAGVRARGISHI